jgi:hypothetical protein
VAGGVWQVVGVFFVERADRLDHVLARDGAALDEANALLSAHPSDAGAAVSAPAFAAASDAGSGPTNGPCDQAAGRPRFRTISARKRSGGEDLTSSPLINRHEVTGSSAQIR